MADPDYVYDPDDWEYTHPWEDRDQVAEDAEVEFAGIKKFKTLVQGPDRFCVFVGNSYRWFNTMGEAEAAWKADADCPQDTTEAGQ
jgi:hypothetical protein